MNLCFRLGFELFIYLPFPWELTDENAFRTCNKINYGTQKINWKLLRGRRRSEWVRDVGRKYKPKNKLRILMKTKLIRLWIYATHTKKECWERKNRPFVIDSIHLTKARDLTFFPFLLLASTFSLFHFTFSAQLYIHIIIKIYFFTHKMCREWAPLSLDPTSNNFGLTLSTTLSLFPLTLTAVHLISNDMEKITRKISAEGIFIERNMWTYSNKLTAELDDDC